MEATYKTLQIEEEVHAKLAEIAKRERRSMSNMAEELILRKWAEMKLSDAMRSPVLEGGNVWVPEGKE